jgi:hypothetical protein
MPGQGSCRFCFVLLPFRRAFAFVIPEYNYFPPIPLVNAIDYLVAEWTYKPAGLVS